MLPSGSFLFPCVASKLAAHCPHSPEAAFRPELTSHRAYRPSHWTPLSPVLPHPNTFCPASPAFCQSQTPFRGLAFPPIRPLLQHPSPLRPGSHCSRWQTVQIVCPSPPLSGDHSMLLQKRLCLSRHRLETPSAPEQSFFDAHCISGCGTGAGMGIQKC